MKQILTVSAAMLGIILIVGWQSTGAEQSNLNASISRLGILHNVSVDGMDARDMTTLAQPSQAQAINVTPFLPSADELPDPGR